MLSLLPSFCLRAIQTFDVLPTLNTSQLSHGYYSLTAKFTSLEHQIACLQNTLREIQSKGQCRLTPTDGKILPGLPSQDMIKEAIVKIGQEDMDNIVKPNKHIYLVW